MEEVGDNTKIVDHKQPKVKQPKSAWDSVVLSRRADRPTAKIILINCSILMELHGDRLSG